MKLAYYTDIEAELDIGNDSVWLTSLHFDGLHNSEFSAVAITLPADTREGTIIVHRINDLVSLIIILNSEDTGKAAFVVDVDPDEMSQFPDLHLCPLCGHDGPFSAACPTEHDLMKSGDLNPKENAKPSKSEHIRTECPKCSHWDERQAFRVIHWIQYPVPETPDIEEAE